MTGAKGHILGPLVLTGLALLIASAFVASRTSDVLISIAVGIAGLGVLGYLVEGWRSGAMGGHGGAKPVDAPIRRDDDDEDDEIRD